MSDYDPDDVLVEAPEDVQYRDVYDWQKVHPVIRVLPYE